MSFRMEGGNSTAAAAIAGVALLTGGGLWLYLSGGLSLFSPQGTYRKVANDLAEQYTQVLAYGTPAEKCAKAGLVAEAFLQAGDDAEYQRWKAQESAQCAQMQP